MAVIAVSHKCDYRTINLNDTADICIAKSPYQWEIADNTLSCVISSSTFEHIPLFWYTFAEMVRVTTVGGYIYLNVPSAGPYHWTSDYWRFRKDSMAALADYQHIHLLESFVDTSPDSEPWCDCVGIFQKL